MSNQWVVTTEPDGNDGRIELSEEMLAQLGLKVGDDEEVILTDGGIRISPSP